jgi:hypothetical protein
MPRSAGPLQPLAVAIVPPSAIAGSTATLRREGWAPPAVVQAVGLGRVPTALPDQKAAGQEQYT